MKYVGAPGGNHSNAITQWAVNIILSAKLENDIVAKFVLTLRESPRMNISRLKNIVFAITLFALENNQNYARLNLNICCFGKMV